MEHRVRIEPHLFLPGLIIAVLVVLQVIAPAPALAFVLAAVLGAVGVGYYWAKQLADKVTLERSRRYGWAQVGDVVEERFTLWNAARLPVLWAEVLDRSTLPGYTTTRVTGVGGEGYTRWVSEGECRQRGVFSLGPVLIRMEDPFGFFTVTMDVGEASSFIVYPVVSALPPLEPPRGAAPGRVRSSRRSPDATPSVSSVRPFVPGDALRRIHWPTTARRDELYVKEYDLDPGGDIWIVLDLHDAVQAGQGEFSTEEYGVTLAASLADAMLRQNRAVGLVCQGAEYTLLPPESGQTQLWRILRALAAARATGQEPLGKVLAQAAPLLGRGITATLITPSVSGEWLTALLDLQQRSVGVNVLLVDAVSFGGRGNVEALVGVLSDRGVATRVVNRGFRFRPLVEHRRQRPTYKVLGTGRVVVVKPGAET